MSAVGTPLEVIFAAVLMLGVLVTVHEFGHFIVAKLCGVRVLKFSVGFGSPIGIGRFRMAWHRGGTDYVVAWIPLGGFVKMLGEIPGEEESPEVLADREHSLGAQATWKKLAIVFAGPAMNLLLPVFVLAGILFVGVDRREPVVGSVEPGSPAAAAELRPGDRILSVDAQPLAWWDDLESRARENPGEALDLVVERDGERLERTLRPEGRAGIDLFQKQVHVGWLGLQHARQKPVVGVVSLSSPAAQAGLRSGDLVLALAGQEVEDWSGLERGYAAASGELSARVARGRDDAAEEFEVALPALGSLEALGVIPAVVLVQDVSPDMPAEQAGLQPGDLIVAMDGQPIGSFFTFQETVAASGGRPIEIQYARGGDTRVVTLRPKKQVIDDLERYLIGIRSEVAMLPGAMGLDRVRNPMVSFPRAFERTLEYTAVFLRGLKMLVTGEISRRAVGGPIEIAKQSHQALQSGWDRFLGLMILISINLGILNLLPIPILDGGQALMFLVEGVKRGPLSMRTREIVQQMGLILIVALMGLAFWNDFSRNWSGFVEWLRGL